MRKVLFVFFILVINFNINSYIYENNNYQEIVKAEIIVKGKRIKDRYIIKFSSYNNKNSFEVMSQEREIGI